MDQLGTVSIFTILNLYYDIYSDLLLSTSRMFCTYVHESLPLILLHYCFTIIALNIL